MIITTHVTASIRQPRSGPLADAFRALALASNNLANVAIEIASRGLESHQNGQLLPEHLLTDRQKEAIRLVNLGIKGVNDNRTVKTNKEVIRQAKLLEQDLEDPKPKGPQRFFVPLGSAGSSRWDIIDQCVLDQACRNHRDELGHSTYEALPAAEAPKVIRAVVRAFDRYKKGEAGHPQPLKSGANRVLEFADHSINRVDGKLPPLSKKPPIDPPKLESKPKSKAKSNVKLKDQSTAVSGLKTALKPDRIPRALFLDRAKNLPLGSEARAAYEAILCNDLEDQFRRILRLEDRVPKVKIPKPPKKSSKKKAASEVDPQDDQQSLSSPDQEHDQKQTSRWVSLRLVHKQGRAWLEGIFEKDVEIHDDSLLAKGLSKTSSAKEQKAGAKAENINKKAALKVKLAEEEYQKAVAAAQAEGKAPPAPFAPAPVKTISASSISKPNLSKSESDGLFAEILAQAWREGPVPSTAALDLGVTNIATAVFSGGHKAIVFSGAPLERATQVLDEKIDARKSHLAKIPSIAMLQGKQAAKTISQKEQRELARLLSDAYGKDKKIVLLFEKRARMVHDAMHQLTHSIVSIMMQRQVQAVAVGRNAGWKECSDQGHEQNRRLHAIPHAKFISMLRGKLLHSGIMLVETEESYTSKASFASNEDLKTYGGGFTFKKKAKAVPKSKVAVKPASSKAAKVPKLPPKAFLRDLAAEASSTKKKQRAAKAAIVKQEKDRVRQQQRKAGALMAGDSETASTPLSLSQLFPAWPEGDKRPGVRTEAKAGAPQNRFYTPEQGRWSNIHADANGAYNIMRKACPGFRRHQGLSSAFEIVHLGPGEAIKAWGSLT